MVIALIPVPAVVSDLNQLMESERLTAVHAQILAEIGLHQRHGGVVRINANDGRLRQDQGLIDPLPDLAVIFSETRAQGIGLHHALGDGVSQQRRVDIPFQLGVVGHAPGVWQRGKLLCHPDTRLGGDERETVHARSPAKEDGSSVCQCPVSHCWHAS